MLRFRALQLPDCLDCWWYTGTTSGLNWDFILLPASVAESVTTETTEPRLVVNAVGVSLQGVKRVAGDRHWDRFGTKTTNSVGAFVGGGQGHE
jgi:hypothetical protein